MNDNYTVLGNHQESINAGDCLLHNGEIVRVVGFVLHLGSVAITVYGDGEKYNIKPNANTKIVVFDD